MSSFCTSMLYDSGLSMLIGTSPGELYKTTIFLKMIALAYLERDLEYIPFQISVIAWNYYSIYKSMCRIITLLKKFPYYPYIIRIYWQHWERKIIPATKQGNVAGMFVPLTKTISCKGISAILMEVRLFIKSPERETTKYSLLLYNT